MSVDSSSIVVAAKDHPAATVGEETVILATDAGRYFGVNTVGARIWQLLQVPRSVADIRDAIVSEYEVDPLRCEADVITLVQEMLQVALVQIKPAAPEASAQQSGTAAH
jgi:hypothetical protein